MAYKKRPLELIGSQESGTSPPPSPPKRQSTVRKRQPKKKRIVVDSSDTEDKSENDIKSSTRIASSLSSLTSKMLKTKVPKPQQKVKLKSSVTHDDSQIETTAFPSKNSISRHLSDSEKLFEDNEYHVDDDHCGMWWLKHEPKYPSDLAVNGKKISEVRDWLNRAYEPQSSIFRMLILVGRAGCGKTITLKSVAKEMGIDIVEWINPIDFSTRHETFDEESISISKKFREFVDRTTRYSALNLTLHSKKSDSRSATTTSPKNSTKKLVLIDDIPNLTNNAASQSFYQTLNSILTSSVPPSYPTIIIVSECFTYNQLTYDFNVDKRQTYRRRARIQNPADSGNATLVGRNNNNSDQGEWTLQSIFPQNILDSPYCQTIKFRPSAKTFLVKGLKRILSLEYNDTRILTKSNKALTEQLTPIAVASEGDIRSAVNMLQWSLPPRIMPAPDLYAPPAVSNKRRRQPPVPVIPIESSLAAANEQNLDLFHALGKVLYSKQKSSRTSEFESTKISSWEIMQKLPVDVGLFELYLNNYYLGFVDSIEEAVEIAELFSVSDEISCLGGWSSMHTGKMYGTSLAVGEMMLNRPNTSDEVCPENQTYAGSCSQSTSSHGSGQENKSRHQGFLQMEKPQYVESQRAIRGYAHDLSLLCRRGYGKPEVAFAMQLLSNVAF
ncbi:RFC checkpoint protein Rad17 [Mycoemilia scoparia]|uniref:RFC checkpoint protein Rad17 n=1 Tax=Mycoemilia scoparia TaxID=417184 RepID=A0A9W8A5N5_9FUNG|nr:RFC checkpoint protein Rad17 [Mycoemilia scoparia]